MNVIPNSYYHTVLNIDVSFIVVADENRAHRVDRDASSMENQRGGRFYFLLSVFAWDIEYGAC